MLLTDTDMSQCKLIIWKIYRLEIKNHWPSRLSVEDTVNYKPCAVVHMDVPILCHTEESVYRLPDNYYSKTKVSYS